MKLEKLNQIVKLYLKENGIKMNFFASYIGCDYDTCVKWIRGAKRKLSREQIHKVHSFLNGDHIKTMAQIVKESKGA